MTEPTPKHYRLLNEGETIRDGDATLTSLNNEWTPVHCGIVQYSTVRRPIESFTESDPDMVEFKKWMAAQNGTWSSSEIWFAALAYARGKK